MHKLKEKMHEHKVHKMQKEHEDHGRAGYDNTAYGSTAYGSDTADNVQVLNAPAGTPVRVVVTEGDGVPGGAAAPMASGTTVNAREFTEVEDRAVEKERVERVVEHVPVEKHYVTETRAVGENVLPATVESQGVTERQINA